MAEHAIEVRFAAHTARIGPIHRIHMIEESQ